MTEPCEVFMLLEFAHEGIGRFNIIICILSAENCLNMVKGSPAIPNCYSLYIRPTGQIRVNVLIFHKDCFLFQTNKRKCIFDKYLRGLIIVRARRFAS